MLIRQVFNKYIFFWLNANFQNEIETLFIVKKRKRKKAKYK